MTGKRLAGFIAATSVAIGLAGSSAAAPITWLISGKIEAVRACCSGPEALLSSPGLEAAGFTPGSSFQSTLVFESSTPDSLSQTDYGRYSGAVQSFEYVAGSHSVLFGADVASGVDVSVEYRFLSFSIVDLSASVDLLASSRVFLEFPSPAGHAPVIGDALPVDPPLLSNVFPFGHDDGNGMGWGTTLVLEGMTDGGYARMYSSISSVVRVPEPGLPGLLPPLALAAFGRGRRS